jgi:hypothetical protein
MNLVQRAQNIMVKPQQEWPVIESEPTTPADLYASYVVPLAAIGPIASIIGLSVIGYSYGGLGSFRFSFVFSILFAIILFVLDLVMVYVIALVVDALAPSFSAQKNFNQAFKLVAYSRTPAWIAAVILIIPSLSIVAGLVGLYGLFLLFVGLPILMKSPQDKTIPYIAVIAIIAIVLSYLIQRITWEIVVRVISPVDFVAF